MAVKKKKAPPDPYDLLHRRPKLWEDHPGKFKPGDIIILGDSISANRGVTAELRKKLGPGGNIYNFGIISSGFASNKHANWQDGSKYIGERAGQGVSLSLLIGHNDYEVPKAGSRAIEAYKAKVRQAIHNLTQNGATLTFNGPIYYPPGSEKTAAMKKLTQIYRDVVDEERKNGNLSVSFVDPMSHVTASHGDPFGRKRNVHPTDENGRILGSIMVQNMGDQGTSPGPIVAAAPPPPRRAPQQPAPAPVATSSRTDYAILAPLKKLTPQRFMELQKMALAGKKKGFSREEFRLYGEYIKQTLAAAGQPFHFAADKVGDGLNGTETMKATAQFAQLVSQAQKKAAESSPVVGEKIAKKGGFDGVAGPIAFDVLAAKNSAQRTAQLGLKK